jgi:hypothetical protein
MNIYLFIFFSKLKRSSSNHQPIILKLFLFYGIEKQLFKKQKPAAKIVYRQWRIRGGGGVRGVRPPKIG